MSLVYPYLYGTNIEGAGLGSVATLTNGSRVVTGLGGAWESALEWGDDISAGGAFAIIQEVVSDTELLLATEWAGPSQVNGPYVVRRGIANADPRNYGRKVAEYLATLRGLPENMRGLYPYPAWDAATTYPKDAVVSHAAALWLALRANTGVEPSEAAAADWAEWLEATPGPQGAPGVDGLDGWSPELAVIADGARRVFQVVDWEGGEGNKPPAGLYVGAGGLVADIAQAIDVRGAPGQDGTGTGDVVGPDGGVAAGEMAVFGSGTGKLIAAPAGGATARNNLYVVAGVGSNATFRLRDEAGTNRGTLYWDRNLGQVWLILHDATGAIQNSLRLTPAGATVGNNAIWHAGNLIFGTGPNQAVQLDASGRLPAVDGSRLTNLPGSGALTKSFVSAPQTWANNGSVNVNHGLGEEPKLVQVFLECVTAQLGWSAGDRFMLASYGNSVPGEGHFGIIARAGATTVTVRIATSGIRIINNSDGSASGVITPGNWRLIVKAFA